jgi:hypothetical protein
VWLLVPVADLGELRLVRLRNTGAGASDARMTGEERQAARLAALDLWTLAKLRSPAGLGGWRIEGPAPAWWCAWVELGRAASWWAERGGRDLRRVKNGARAGSEVTPIPSGQPSLPRDRT